MDNANNSKQAVQVSFTVERRGGAVRQTKETTVGKLDKLLAKLDMMNAYQVECRYEIAR